MRTEAVLETVELFNLAHTMASEYLRRFRYPWEALDGIGDFILSLEAELPNAGFERRAPHVCLHKTARVAPTAFLGAPCVIGAETELCHSRLSASAL